MGRMIMTVGNRVSWRLICRTATLFVTNPTRPDLRYYMGFGGDRQRTNRLRHATAQAFIYVPNKIRIFHRL